MLTDENRRDQESAQYEEDVDADESAREPTTGVEWARTSEDVQFRHVEEHHEHDGDASRPIEGRHATGGRSCPIRFAHRSLPTRRSGMSRSIIAQCCSTAFTAKSTRDGSTAAIVSALPYSPGSVRTACTVGDVFICEERVEANPHTSANRSPGEFDLQFGAVVLDLDFNLHLDLVTDRHTVTQALDRELDLVVAGERVGQAMEPRSGLLPSESS